MKRKGPGAIVRLEARKATCVCRIERHERQIVIGIHARELAEILGLKLMEATQMRY